MFGEVSVQASSSSVVVSAESAGLGNRIKSWASAMRLGDDARVYWPLNAKMPAGFSELFANECEVDTIPAGARENVSWRLALLPEDEPHLSEGFAVVGGGAHPVFRELGKWLWEVRGKPSNRYEYMVFPKSYSRRSSRPDARHIDLEYGRIPEYFRRLYVPLFKRIVPCPVIQQRVDDWAAEFLGSDVIGVQVRTWRDDRHRHRKYHLPALGRLMKLMRTADPAARFLLVSDSDEIVCALTRQFGSPRIIAFPRAVPREQSWESPLGVQEDLIEMLLLSRTQRIFASYLSTFSEAAWWLGGAEAQVTVF